MNGLSCLFFALSLMLRVDPPPAGCVYGLVIDTSGSMRPAVDQATTAARLLIEKARPGDRFFLMKFADEITLEVATTDQKKELLDALNNLIVWGHPSTVLDAVFLAAGEMNKAGQSTGCKALVLITDGDEQASYTKQADALKTLGEQRLPVFAIGFPHIIPKQRGKKAQRDAVKLLERLAKVSGGQAWFPRSEAELAGVVDGILKRSGE